MEERRKSSALAMACCWINFASYSIQHRLLTYTHNWSIINDYNIRNTRGFTEVNETIWFWLQFSLTKPNGLYNVKGHQPKNNLVAYHLSTSISIRTWLVPEYYVSYIDKCSHACAQHDDVTKWKYFPRFWPLVWWIPLINASDAELWCFLWSAPE